MAIIENKEGLAMRKDQMLKYLGERKEMFRNYLKNLRPPAQKANAPRKTKSNRAG